MLRLMSNNIWWCDSNQPAWEAIGEDCSAAARAKGFARVYSELCPDVILCIGQAGGRAAITPEQVGINLRYAPIPDNKGNQPTDEPIISGGATAYFSTLPVRRIAEAIKASGIPSQVSYSAGAYVCNDLLYTLLSRYDGSNTRVGFIHIPFSAEQNKTPCMELCDIIKGLTAAIMALDR